MGRVRWSTSQRWLLVAVLVVVVVVRGAAVLVVFDANPSATVEGDTHTYVQPALALLEDGRFSRSPDDSRPEFVRTPGYPAFIAGVYGVFGDDPTAVLLVQVLISGLVVLVVALLAARMWSPAAGLVAALLVAFDPLQIYTTGTLLSESLDTMLVVLVAACGFRVFADERPLPRWLFALGTAIALATMVRPVTYYLPLVVVVLLGYRVGRRPELRRAAMGLFVAFLAPLVVIVGGWQLRNYNQIGSWRFSGVEAQNLYFYRAAAVVADQDHISLDAAQDKLRGQLEPIKQQGPGAYYGQMYHDAWRIMSSDPIEVAENAASGALSELTGTQHKFFAYLGLTELPDVVDVIALALLVGFYGLALSGMIHTARTRRDLLAHLFVIGLAVYILIVSAGPEAIGGRGERFRAVAMPILALYAARGIVQPLTRRHPHRTFPPSARHSFPS